MTEKEKMLSGELYDANDSELVELRRSARRKLEQFNGAVFDADQQRVQILKSLFNHMWSNSPTLWAGKS